MCRAGLLPGRPPKGPFRYQLSRVSQRREPVVRRGLAVSVVLGGDRTGCVFSTKFAVEFHDLSHQLLDQILTKNAVLPRGQFGHGLRDSLDILSASSLSTLSDPSGAGEYSAKNSSISSTIRQWRQGRSCSFSDSAMTYLSFRPNSGSHGLYGLPISPTCSGLSDIVRTQGFFGRPFYALSH